MKRPTFFEGVAVAFAVSLTGSALYASLTAVLPGAWVLRALIPLMGLAYVMYLLARSRPRVGRVTTLAAWAMAAGAAWFIQPPLVIYVLVHVGLIWLIRSLYAYASVLSALADLGLSALSLAAAIWAATQSSSVFLSLWCFFLVQALFVAIPARLGRKTGTERGARDGEDDFERAHRAAETALRRLYSVR